MKKPKMIIFDYGDTLLCELSRDFYLGEQEVFKHVVKNPMGVTAEEVCDFGLALFRRFQDARNQELEIHEWNGMRMKYEYFGIELDIPFEEAEELAWEHASVGGKMPYVEEMLAYLHEQGIRTGVISNIGWSGKALTARLNRLLPDNHFEFVIASSDYVLRKPNSLIFELALRKAGLSAEDVWFCGDNVRADVCGAAGAGIYPVWYQGVSEDNPFALKAQSAPEVEHLRVEDWRELIEMLEELKIGRCQCWQ